MRSLRHIVLSLAICIGAFRSEATVCSQELGIALRPADTVIAVGERFTQRVELTSCGGAQLLSDSFTWSSTVPTVATVGATSGVVVGLSRGTTTLAVTGARYGSVGEVRVTVR